MSAGCRLWTVKNLFPNRQNPAADFNAATFDSGAFAATGTQGSDGVDADSLGFEGGIERVSLTTLPKKSRRAKSRAIVTHWEATSLLAAASEVSAIAATDIHDNTTTAPVKVMLPARVRLRMLLPPSLVQTSVFHCMIPTGLS